MGRRKKDAPEKPKVDRKRPKAFDHDGMIELVSWLIKKATDDYRCALRLRNERNIAECEKFFLSEYFQGLTSLDGQAIIDKIRREFAHAK